MQNTVGLISLGCAKNRVDSEVLLGMLCERGYKIVSDPKDAEIIFVNTCGFIEPAKEESIESILEMAEYKKRGTLKKLFVTGCLVQRYAKELSEEMPEVDGFLGVAEYARVFEMLGQSERGMRPCFMGEGERFLNQKRVLTTPSYSAYVKISDGCDNRCSYCAIPLIRGRYRSRPFDDIVEECRILSAQGVSEICLIAQDTSRYGTDFPGKSPGLADLLEAVCALEGIHWVRVLYLYPDTTDDHLLETMMRLDKVAKYLDLPLQHINDDLLKKMNRRGSKTWIESRIEKCKQMGFTLRTTMIVGFPGETDAQFAELVDFVKWARFDRLGAFTYSPEEGTGAAEMPDQVPEEVKTKRLDQLMMLQQSISLEKNERRVGKTYEVLVEGKSGEKYVGRSICEAPESDGSIFFTAKNSLAPGAYVMVKLTGADAYDLFGEAIE